jgi:putative transposase
LETGLAEYFIFYNGERPHQSLGHKTPDVVYRTAMGGGALIVDKYPKEVPVEDVSPVPLCSTGVGMRNSV